MLRTLLAALGSGLALAYARFGPDAVLEIRHLYYKFVT